MQLQARSYLQKQVPAHIRPRQVVRGVRKLVGRVRLNIRPAHRAKVLLHLEKRIVATGVADRGECFGVVVHACSHVAVL